MNDIRAAAERLRVAREYLRDQMPLELKADSTIEYVQSVLTLAENDLAQNQPDDDVPTRNQLLDKIAGLEATIDLFNKPHAKLAVELSTMAAELKRENDDDALFVSIEWLHSVGFVHRGLGEHVFGPLMIEYGTGCGWLYSIGSGDRLQRDFTRGDVRNLCRALGVELKQ